MRTVTRLLHNIKSEWIEADTTQTLDEWKENTYGVVCILQDGFINDITIEFNTAVMLSIKYNIRGLVDALYESD